MAVDLSVRRDLTLPKIPKVTGVNNSLTNDNDADNGALHCTKQGRVGLTTKELLRDLAFPLLQQKPVVVDCSDVTDDAIALTNIDHNALVVVTYNAPLTLPGDIHNRSDGADCYALLVLNATDNSLTINNAKKVTGLVPKGDTAADATPGTVTLSSEELPVKIPAGEARLFLCNSLNPIPWHQVDFDSAQALQAHIDEGKNHTGTNPHGAEIDAVPKSIMARDDKGQAKVETPAEVSDANKQYIANQGFVDTQDVKVKQALGGDKWIETYGAESSNRLTLMSLDERVKDVKDTISKAGGSGDGGNTLATNDTVDNKIAKGLAHYVQVISFSDSVLTLRGTPE